MSVSQERLVELSAAVMDMAVRAGVKQVSGNPAEWDRCAQDADRFINEYTVIDQPQGAELAETPFHLWPSQSGALARMVTSKLLVILKARQLGITWLCCAYALWLCLFRPGRVVLLFSKGEIEAYELARRIRVMYARLPEWMRAKCTLIKDNTSEMAWSNGSRIQSLAATRSAGRSFTASLVLMDEAAFMQWGTEVYTALKPTIDGGGQLFVVSTANGEQGLFHKLWTDAVGKVNNFATVFLSWKDRPDRDEAWRAQVAADALSSVMDLQEYPSTAEQAFQNTGNERFLQSMIWWDACMSELPPLDSRTPIVLAADAGISSDAFGLVGVSLHPQDSERVAVRYVRAWEPKGNKLDFDEIEAEIRRICKAFNVIQLPYDPYQLHQMMTGLGNDGITMTDEFNQGGEREIADKQLLDLILNRRIAHDGDLLLRKHIDNADKKVSQDRKLRLVKRSESLKIDLAVCVSMAAKRILELPVTNVSDNERRLFESIGSRRGI